MSILFRIEITKSEGFWVFSLTLRTAVIWQITRMNCMELGFLRRVLCLLQHCIRLSGGLVVEEESHAKGMGSEKPCYRRARMWKEPTKFAQSTNMSMPRGGMWGNV